MVTDQAVIAQAAVEAMKAVVKAMAVAESEGSSGARVTKQAQDPG